MKLWSLKENKWKLKAEGIILSEASQAQKGKCCTQINLHADSSIQMLLLLLVCLCVGGWVWVFDGEVGRVIAYK